MKNVTIYSTPICHHCHEAKDFLNQHNIQFVNKDISASKNFLNEMISKSGQMSTPVIEIDGQIILGFDQSKLSELLEIK